MHVSMWGGGAESHREESPRAGAGPGAKAGLTPHQRYDINFSALTFNTGIPTPNNRMNEIMIIVAKVGEIIRTPKPNDIQPSFGLRKSLFHNAQP